MSVAERLAVRGVKFPILDDRVTILQNRAVFDDDSLTDPGFICMRTATVQADDDNND
jgi:hypothetical protein